MSDYRPANPLQWLLTKAEPWQNAIGRSARRKLMRRYKKRAEADYRRIRAALGPGDICLDLGANVSEVTADLAATGALVHAYEPDPETFAKLQAKVGHLPNVVLHQAAVGAKPGTVHLRRERHYATDPTKYSVGSSVVFDDARMDQTNSVDVRQVAFADVLAGFDRKVAFIKMDIEGSELAILADLFARGDFSGFERLYAETRQHLRPADMPEILRLRKAAAALHTPDINLYWR